MRDPDVYALAICSSLEGVFSAGGDLRELSGLLHQGAGLAEASAAAEYRLIWQLDCFTKPTIALIDGMIMGSAAGLVASGTHRVAGERYSFAMPETAVGFFPDVGMARTLARLERGVGNYLGLTGAAIGRADAYRFGLVTHCISAGHFDHIKERLSDADVVDPLLDSLHVDPGVGELEPYMETIGRCFPVGRVETILERLDDESGPHRAWARDVATVLRTRSPFALKLTHALLQRAASFDLPTTLIHDNRLARACFTHPDFAEGVRALLIDKDRKPRWSPADVRDVADASVARVFELLSEGELMLSPRSVLQAQAG
jgi:enoyl-CoA hydratase